MITLLLCHDILQMGMAVDFLSVSAFFSVIVEDCAAVLQLSCF